MARWSRRRRGGVISQPMAVMLPAGTRVCSLPPRPAEPRLTIAISGAVVGDQEEAARVIAEAVNRSMGGRL